MNQAGLALVKRFEGFRPRAYLCPAGVPTIGYGCTKDVKLGDVITLADAETRFAAELAEFEHGVIAECSNLPNENQAAAMSSLAYNIGLGAFKKSTVLRKHNLGDFDAAADAFRMWCKGGGRVLPGLVARREAERALYLT